MKLGVYTDYIYRQVDGVVYAERAFALFLAPLASRVERLVLIGRFSPEPDTSGYSLGRDITLARLHHYGTLANPALALWALLLSLREMWRALDEVEVLWALGPYPHAIMLILFAWMRRRRIVLGVRQDWPRYVRMRRPGRRMLHRAADIMESVWRGLARRFPVVAVGSELGIAYAHAPAVLDLSVSLVPARAVTQSPPRRDYQSEVVILSVGRLEEEKNPLLLVDVLERLHRRDPRWRLRVAGVGGLAAAIDERARRAGLSDRVEQLGYVAMGPPLMDLYRSSHVFLHVSWTEGFPQVLIEAFAAGLPVVATAVGGVAAGVGDAGILIPPGDVERAVEAVSRVVRDSALREQIVTAGLSRARELTQEAQTERLVSFLEAAQLRRPPRTGWSTR